MFESDSDGGFICTVPAPLAPIFDRITKAAATLAKDHPDAKTLLLTYADEMKADLGVVRTVFTV